MLLFLNACSTQNAPGYSTYLERKNIPEPTLESFAHCHGYGCERYKDITLTAEQWQQIGVRTEIVQADSGTQLREWLSNGEFDVALVDVTPNGDPDLYDFWSQEAIIAGQNYGGWNNRRASEALESGRQLWPVAERRPSYDSFIRIFNNNLPALSLYQHADTYALSDTVVA